MSSELFTRVLVYIKKTSTLTLASFDRCIFRQLGINDSDKLESAVFCQLHKKKLIISLLDNDDDDDGAACLHNGPHLLKHPHFCPVLSLNNEERENLPADIKSRGIDVGVAVLLESKEGKLLITRRAHHMRTFPGIWVPPGGHVEVGETLEEAGMRELAEETGIALEDRTKCTTEILGLWESVYPPFLSMGSPKRHHIVVYLHVKCYLNMHHLQQSLKLNPSEVDASTWINENLINAIVHGSSSIPEENLPITLVAKNGEHFSSEIDANVLKEKIPSPGVDVERLSTGTRYALSLWLKKTKLVSKSSL